MVLSERYITDRFLPDKAIDLLDEACACAALRNKDAEEYYRSRQESEALRQETEELEADVENIDYEQYRRAQERACASWMKRWQQLRPAAENAPVSEDDLAQVIELWTGIPASKVRESDLRRLRGAGGSA